MTSNVYPTASNNPAAATATSVTLSRRRTHSWSSPEPESASSSSFPFQQHPRRRAADGPLVRTGPIMFALAFCCIVPLVIVNITTSLAVSRKYRPDTPAFYSSNSQRRRWMNPRYIILNHRTAFEMVDPIRRRCDVHSIRQKSETIHQMDPNDNLAVPEAPTTTTTDWIFVDEEDDHQVMIAVVIVPKKSHNENNKSDHQIKQSMPPQPQWIFSYQESYAIPGSRWLSPITARCSNQQSPFAAAKNTIALLLLGTSFQKHEQQKQGTNNDMQFPMVEYDDYNIPIGNIPQDPNLPGINNGGSSEKYQLHWTFLGRYRNHADYGGGFTFTYLLRMILSEAEDDFTDHSNSLFQFPVHPYRNPESLSSIPLPSVLESLKKTSSRLPPSVVLVQMSSLHVEEALEQGQLFPEIRGAATIGLALHYL